VLITSPRLLAAVLAASLGFAGCVSAYADALERGDAMARAGAWDEAATSYEAALRLEPGSNTARERLAQARRGQAAARVAAGWALLQRSDFAAAVGAMQEAARFDPTSPEVQRALEVAGARALEHGERLLADDRAREALDLALLVRRAAPSDPRALSLENRARDVLATASYARAEALLAANKRGNALLAFAETTRTRPGYRDAAGRAAAVRNDLENELRFFAVVERGASSLGVNDDLAQAAAFELRAAPDQARPLLSIVDRAPSNALGIRLAVKLDGYAAAHDVRRERRSCSWVCATDRLPNPEFQAARLAAADAERRAGVTEEEAGRARDLIDARRRDDLVAAAEVERSEHALTRARTDLEACRSAEHGAPTRARCHDEEEALRVAERAHEAADVARVGTRGALSLAEARWKEADQARDRARLSWQREVARLGRTSPFREVDRSCTHDYTVSIHTAREEVALLLHAGVLGEGEPTDLPPVHYEIARSDETFDAAPGRCPEVAAGDPLSLPSRQELDRALVERVVAGVRESVQGSYDEYRRGFLEAEKRERIAGHPDDANEARVRYLLTGADPPPELRVVPSAGDG